MKLKGIFLAVCWVFGVLEGVGQVVLTPTDDCYIYAAGSKAGEAYGVLDKDSLKVRKSVASEEFTRETYLMFDLGTIDTTFLSAKVMLYGVVAESKRTLIYYTDTTWDEQTLTGNTRPPGNYITDLILTTGQGYYAWDVTSYLNQAMEEGRHRVAFILKDVAGAVSTKDSRWMSKENPISKPPKLELVEGPLPYHRPGAYYVDSDSGNDMNTAASPSEAWKSLTRINQETFKPGDSVLFKAGGVWQGNLSFRGSGQPGKPIVVGSYGSGAKPLLNGAGTAENTVQFIDQHHMILQDLHITNLGDTVAFRRGIYIRAEDMGVVKQIILRRLEVSDVNGSLAGEVSKNNGGIFFEISGSARPTCFDTLIVEECYIHDVDRTGISNRSTWDERSLTNNVNWFPSKNVVMRNNIIENTGANGMIVRVAKNPLMEYNLFTRCGQRGSGNACFSFNTDSAVWQFNESCYTRYNSGDDDAGGFDSDYNSKYTMIQYNYSHDNDFGALLLTGGPSGNFNEGTVIRYNVLVNNRDHQIRTSGKATNSLIYNNTIYTGTGINNVAQVWHKSWGGYSQNTKYYNNIFQVMGSGASVELGQSTGNVFDYNIFYGTTISGEPADAHKIKESPQFVRPGAPSGFDSLDGFRLQQGSPAINSGMVVPGSPVRDFEGNPVPTYNTPDRGAFEYTGPYGLNDPAVPPSMTLFPNPASDFVRLTFPTPPDPNSTLTVFGMDGRIMMESLVNPTSNLHEVEFDLRIHRLKAGMYLLSVRSGNQVYRKELIVVH
jgi:hypothetical protein